MERKFIAVFIPMVGILTFSLIAMIKSFNTNETWRIIFSVAGFIICIGLTSLFVYPILRKMKSERK